MNSERNEYRPFYACAQVGSSQNELPDHDVVDLTAISDSDTVTDADTDTEREALSDADTDTDADTEREALSDSTVTKRGPLFVMVIPEMRWFSQMSDNAKKQHLGKVPNKLHPFNAHHPSLSQNSPQLGAANNQPLTSILSVSVEEAGLTNISECTLHNVG